jgi:GLTT repeat (6 copies)
LAILCGLIFTAGGVMPFHSASRIGLPSAGLPSAGLPSAGLPSAGLPSAGLPSAGLPEERQPRPAGDGELSAVARGLEDESYRRWLEHRDAVPESWRRDEAFSQVVYLTPDEMAGMAEVIRALIAQYRHREDRPAARPAEAAPVAVVARLFPLLAPGAGPAPGAR